MVAPCYLSQSSLEHGLGTGSAMNNEKLYIVEGVDMYGRKFTGLYTESEARYLVERDRLNTVYDRITHDVVQFTN